MNVKFQVRYVNRYFDFNDFELPIKDYIEDRLFFPVEPYIKKSAQLYVKKSFTDLSDSLFPFDSSNNITFLSVDNILRYTSKLDYINFALVSVALRLYFEYDIYKRQIYTFSDLLADIGCIQQSLFSIGAVIVGLFYEKLLYSQIISDIYQTQPLKNYKQRNIFKSKRK